MTREQRIAFLLARRFPILQGLRPEAMDRKLKGFNPDAAERIDAYRIELRAMPPAILDELFESEFTAAAAQREAEARHQEAQRFYNQPHALADFDHWSRMAHWSIDEAVALTLGRAPEVVTWEAVKPLVNISPFAIQYKRLRDLALRAVPWQKLFDPVLPSIYVEWCKQYDIAFPAALEMALLAHGYQFTNWPRAYVALKKQFDDYIQQSNAMAREIGENLANVVADHDRNQQEAQQTIMTLTRERDDLKAHLERLRAEPERSLRTRERGSLLKLIAGMAVGGYGYDRTLARNDKVAEIASDLDRLGMHLDLDTVRKWLQEAMEHLPRDIEPAAV